MQSYLFYDIETTGLNKAFDQVLHFAAIRTDLDLNELNRYEIKIKLNPDVIPSPAAVLTHKISFAEMNQGMNEYDAMQQIHSWMNEPGTVSLGYNTLGFDDEFLRFSFYRNLLSPYTHQYANRCSRMDIYPITVMFFLFKNEILSWPQSDNKTSLKLEDLNRANQFIVGRSHHAMVDVEVTLELARKLLREKEMWVYLQNYFNKQIDLERMQPLQKEMALVVDGVFGGKNAYQCPAFFLGNHQVYKNQSIWLRIDTENFMDATIDSFKDNFRSIQKKPGEPVFILPFKDRFLKSLSPDRLACAANNFAWLQNNPALLQAVKHYYTHYTYPNFPGVDQDARLYLDGFLSATGNLFCKQFQAASAAGKSQLLASAPSDGLSELALRILGKHYPDTLSEKHSKIFKQFLDSIYLNNDQKAPIDYLGRSKLTLAKMNEDIEQLKKERALEQEDLNLLRSLKEGMALRFT